MTPAGDEPATPEDQPDRSKLNLARSWNRAMADTFALMDLIDGVLPGLDDSHIVWLIGYLRRAGRRRPHDLRNPWTTVLHRDDVEIVWESGGWAGGTTTTETGYTVELESEGRTQEQMRATLAHELAHIELALFNRKADGSLVVDEDEWRRQEQEVDEYAAERFDTDPRNFPT